MKLIDKKLIEARTNKEWREDFMTLQLKLNEKLNEGRKEGLLEAIQKLLNTFSPEEIEKLGFSKEDIQKAQELS